MERKGTITELSSLFPVEEAQKASMRVQDAIAERKQQLNQLKGFIDDNVSIINLVQKLPDETHHNIMVPFGKAAFFPGRLIHTNEFMVLIGEGYYAERTSKQTVEILKRRGKALETQTESLKAIMQDLKAEASFFDATANESSEGLVEIREDYIEEDSSGTSSVAESRKSDNIPLEVNNGRATEDDEEYARIFARMAELEKEEDEAEKAENCDDDEQAQSADQESEKSDMSSEDELTQSTAQEADLNLRKQISSYQEADVQIRRQNPTDQEADVQIQRQISTDQVRSTQVKNSEMLAVPKGEIPRGDHPRVNNNLMDKAPERPQEENKIQPFPASSMAFTGSIVERNVGVNLPEQQTSTRGSKPVSRFKMQRK